MMKKMLGILLAAVMILTMACAAAEDAIPQPEAGKKFEGNWAVQNMQISIFYEEQGYKVFIETKNYEAQSGTRWEYSCVYQEADDALVSVASSKAAFIFDEDDPDQLNFDAPAYEGFDDDNTATKFAIDENGCLVWKDGRGNDGAGLVFQNIGDFGGSWKNEAEAVDAEITWNGEDDAFFYNVWIQRGASDAQTFVVFDMTGVYNAETGKLECSGVAVENTRNAAGEYEEKEDGEVYEAFFSMTEDGKLLFETDNGIVLEHYDSIG